MPDILLINRACHSSSSSPTTTKTVPTALAFLSVTAIAYVEGRNIMRFFQGCKAEAFPKKKNLTNKNPVHGKLKS
jgi:hypothetical protein